MKQQPRVATVDLRGSFARLAATAGSLLLALLLLALPAAGQVVVDDFATVQGPNDDPPGNPSSSIGAGGMLGGERDLAVARSGGSGTVSAEVDGTSLLFSAPSSPDATRGQATITWDGTDGDADALAPTGLGSEDLTDGGTQGGFAVTIEAADAGAQIVVEVYTDAANASRAARVLPGIASQTVVFVDFSELTQIEGTGFTGPADLSDVGAVVLRVLGTEVNVEVSDLRTAPPTVAAAKVDLDAGGTPIAGSVVPGQTVRYRITIDNPGAGAEGVDLSDMVDPSLIPLVANSVRTTPVTRTDNYSGFGNVTLVVDGITRPSVLANDNDPDGDAVTVDTGASDTVSAQGGTVTLAADGTFTYLPPAGFKGIDSFTYTLMAVAGDPTLNASGAAVGPITGTVNIDLSRTIWFVDNSHGGPFLGTQANPFDTLKDAEMNSGPGDIIRLRQGDGTVNKQNQGLILKANQMLVGGGVPLEVDGQVIEPADPGRPIMTHTAANGIDLAQNHEVHGVNIASSAAKALFGTDVGSLRITEVSVVDAGGEAIHIDGGALDLTFDLLDSLSSSGHGVRFNNVTGAVTATTTDIDDPFDAGISIESSPGASFSFGATSVDGAGDTMGGARAGIEVLNSAGATVTFASIGSLTTERGPGIRTLDGGTVDIQTAGASVSATGGAALDVENTALMTGVTAGWTFTSLSSTGSPAEGVRLVALLDPVTVNTGTTVTNPDTTGLLVQGSPGVAFDFGATSVTDTSIGSGATADGIDLAGGNPGATFTFDSLAVVTDGGYGLQANNSGTVNIGGATNVISATGGPALDVAATGVGAPGWTFSTLSSTGSGSTGINMVGLVGAITGNGGAVTGSAGTAVNVSGGAPAFAYAGTVTQTNAARVVNVENTTGAIASFLAKVTGGASSTGVRIHNADGDASFSDLDLGTDGSRLTSTALTLSGGSTGTFTFADTQIFTDGAPGIDANNGGALEVTGAGNRVTSSSATAVALMGGTTVGPGGVTFQRIDSNNATHGIRLLNTGSDGTFSVTGAPGALATDCGGTFPPSSATCSGGIIQNQTMHGVELASVTGVSLAYMHLEDANTTDGGGAGNCDGNTNTNCRAAVKMTTATNVALDNISIDDTEEIGISGETVTNFDLSDSVIQNAGNATDEHGLYLRNLMGTVSGGAVNTISNTIVDGSSNFNLFVQNDAATNAVGGEHDRLEISGSTFRNTPIATTGGDGITFSGRMNSNMKLMVSSSTLTNNATEGAQCDQGDGGLMECTFTGSTINSNNIGLNMSASGTATLRFDIRNNIEINSRAGGAQVVNVFAGANSTVHGRIQDNDDMDTASTNATGIDAIAEGALLGGTAKLVLLVDDNTINVSSVGINGRASQGGAGNTGELHITVTDNTVNSNNIGFGNDGIEINAGSSAGGTGHKVCLNITGNTVTGGGFDQDIKLRQRVNQIYNIQGLGTMALCSGSNCDGTVEADVETFVGALNTPTRGLVDVTIDGAGFGNETCETPTLPVS